MNLYVRIVNDVIDHIEENIHEPLTLHNLSQQFYLSEFHFSRLFKILTGINLKQYILGRKLSLASEKLRYSDCSVTDAAYAFGFEYPEVFSRAFKKQFGVSPSLYKNGNYNIAVIPKASAVERNIANVQGTLALKETSVYLDGVNLYGVFIDVNEKSANFEYALKSTGDNFFSTYADYCEDEELYSVVNCHEDDCGEYTIFFGGKIVPVNHKSKLDTRNIPAGWYACFTYHGKMIDMRRTFVDDFYHWIMIKEIELCPNGIGMLNIYDRQDVKNVRILVPIIAPK